jgi:uncharacterized membrane-anchored protein
MALNRNAGEGAGGEWLSKVPQVTLMFWVIKIFATTVGETGGDALTKPHDEGGLDLKRSTCSLAIAAVMVALIFLTYRSSRRAAGPPDPERV